MRGDTAVAMRLLLRRAGLGGLAAVAGGILAIVTAAVSWHDVLATVDLLGASSQRVEARLGGLDAWWGWLVPAAGAGAVWLGAGVAFDRPVRWAQIGLAAVAGLLAACAIAAMLAPPPVLSVLGPDHAANRVADRLPAGVALELSVRASLGPWFALAAAALVSVGAATGRDA